MAAAYEVRLDEKAIIQKLLFISERASGQLISTYEDMRHQRRTEIENLNLDITISPGHSKARFSPIYKGNGRNHIYEIKPLSNRLKII